ncbi:MAG: hypothetical protein IIC40_05290 [Candidatus Marinimicrobia bacterium]|nr:hypothetical protein [Candidatus Neomarinimicrobiota bacterium]
MLTEIELEGIIGELEIAMSEMFPEVSITNYVKEVEGSIVVYLSTPNDDIPEIEEELASKSAELDTEYDCEFIFVVKNEYIDNASTE